MENKISDRVGNIALMQTSGQENQRTFLGRLFSVLFLLFCEDLMHIYVGCISGLWRGTLKWVDKWAAFFSGSRWAI